MCDANNGSIFSILFWNKEKREKNKGFDLLVMDGIGKNQKWLPQTNFEKVSYVWF